MFKNLKNNVDKLIKNLEEVESTKQLSFTELFTPTFLSECSSFTSLEDLFEKSGFKVESPEDFKKIPNEEWERFIVENTSYESWLDMQKDAATKLLNQRIMKGL